MRVFHCDACGRRIEDGDSSLFSCRSKLMVTVSSLSGLGYSDNPKDLCTSCGIKLENLFKNVEWSIAEKR